MDEEREAKLAEKNKRVNDRNTQRRMRSVKSGMTEEEEKNQTMIDNTPSKQLDPYE